MLPQTTQKLPIALDATSIGQNFTVLSINVLYRSCGIPIAWKVVKATEKGSWKPYWQELLSSLKEIVPSDWNVIVSGERGLYANWLYQQIVDLGWHPFLRINHQGQFLDRTQSLVGDQDQWIPLSIVVPSTRTSWSGEISCLKTNPIDCTLLARWDEGYADPWLYICKNQPRVSKCPLVWISFLD